MEQNIIYYECKKRWGDLDYFKSKGYEIKTGQDCSTWINGIEGLSPTGYNSTGKIDLDKIDDTTKQFLKDMAEKEIITIIDKDNKYHRGRKLF